jgi:protein phosphatase 1 regulatory subunit 7
VLILRQNLIEDLVDLRALCPNLRYVDFYDNRLPRIHGLAQLGQLRYLDLSFNEIRQIEGLQELVCFVGFGLLFLASAYTHTHTISLSLFFFLSFSPSLGISFFCQPILHDLFLINNKLKRIDSGIRDCTSLRQLELGSNRIRYRLRCSSVSMDSHLSSLISHLSSQIENLEPLINLQQLWLGRNKIETISGLSTLTQLQRLSLQSNRIRQIQGLDNLLHLRELYLSHNGLSEIGPGLAALCFLRVLDLSYNTIARIDHLRHMRLLEELWINNNQISNYDDLVLCRLVFSALVVFPSHSLLHSSRFRVHRWKHCSWKATPCVRILSTETKWPPC